MSAIGVASRDLSPSACRPPDPVERALDPRIRRRVAVLQPAQGDEHVDLADSSRSPELLGRRDDPLERVERLLGRQEAVARLGAPELDLDLPAPPPLALLRGRGLAGRGRRS